MNETELRRYCLEHAGENLTAEAEALIARDPELQQQLARLITVKKLMSLKRYEQPSPACTQRCIQAVAARIEQQHNGGLLLRLQQWMEFEHPMMVKVAYAAALIVCVTGIGFYAQRSTEVPALASVEIPVVQPEVIVEPVMASTVIPVAPVAPIAPIAPVAPAVPEPVVFVQTSESATTKISIYDMPEFEKPLIVLQVTSNPQPSRARMSFGSEASVPVNFDF